MTNIADWLNSGHLIVWFFKAFAIVFTSMYLLFGIVIYKQTQIMIKTVESPKSALMLLISLIQIGAAVVLLFWAIML